MGYEHKDGSGSLFKNDKKQKETSPDYRGDFKLNGQLYELSGWKKQGKNGDFLSLSVRVKTESQNKPAESRAPDPQNAWGDDGSDLPF